VSTDIAVTPIDVFTGIFAGTAQSVAPGVLELGMNGSFICGNPNCDPGNVNTFVGDIAGLAGTFRLPGRRRGGESGSGRDYLRAAP
jgi:hypothetical protein